jgi:hypothetical protein
VNFLRVLVIGILQETGYVSLIRGNSTFKRGKTCAGTVLCLAWAPPKAQIIPNPLKTLMDPLYSLHWQLHLGQFSLDQLLLHTRKAKNGNSNGNDGFDFCAA